MKLPIFTHKCFPWLQEKTSRTVWHYQFTSWPDHGVPDTPTPALDFVRTVRESVLMDHGPLVVHCRSLAIILCYGQQCVQGVVGSMRMLL